MPSLVKTAFNWAHIRGGPSSPPQPDLCEICGKKPKFIDNGFKHPYCSRSCARSGQGPNGPNPSACLLRGCRATGRPAFANFCSDLHAREGVRVGAIAGCSQCQVQPKSIGNFCISCERQARAAAQPSGPRLRELKPDGATFKSLRAQFLSEWESGGSPPSFEKVFEVVLPREHRLRYDQYKLSMPSLAEVRSFHSSQCICDMGSKDAALCNFKSCGICCIVKSAFRSFAFGVPCNKGRFGEGIYSYRNPALADLFATSCTSSPYRVMIACDVAVEAGQLSNDENESLYVQSADSILPAFVIMYTAK